LVSYQIACAYSILATDTKSNLMVKLFLLTITVVRDNRQHLSEALYDGGTPVYTCTEGKYIAVIKLSIHLTCMAPQICMQALKSI